MIRRLLCRLLHHNFEWEMRIDRPSALVCKRCGHREEEGMKYVLEMFLK